METWHPKKLNFEPIDRIIDDWVQHNKLNLMKEYKDCDVRSVDLTDSTGSRRVQIWIDPVEDDRTTINVWKIPRRSRDNKPPTRIPANKENLRSALDEAVEMANDWLTD